jgi:ABC-type Fe3+/spermidine/putrescine transport system ATPase subunit
MAGVRFERLRKSFGGRVAVDIDELEIRDGEFFSLLGPSGCGKTTTLRLVAGLVAADSGRVLIGGRDATAIPCAQRNLGMVFQKYALFPHLTVAENVAYGLRERRVADAEVRRRVSDALALVALPDCADRYPHQLSGGQQQRVAVARAVVYRPDVLLLDEPMSNLDVKLRIAMRAELKRLQQTLGITTLFVTHDQHEALALSDRVGVMREGRMEQLGTPEQIYDAPRSVFVADFVGGTNVLSGVARGVGDDALEVELDGGHTISVREASSVNRPAGTRVNVAMKPERIRLDPSSATCTGEVEAVAYLGSVFSYILRFGSQRLEARVGEAATVDGRPVKAGDLVGWSVDAASARILDA